jgi:hypothetical protein
VTVTGSADTVTVTGFSAGAVTVTGGFAGSVIVILTVVSLHADGEGGGGGGGGFGGPFVGAGTG